MAWATIPDISKGLNLDATPEEVESGVATSGSNVRFRTGYAERFRGMESVLTPAITPYHLCHFTVGNSYFLVLPGLASTYAWDGTTATDISNGANTGAIDDRWCGFVFNGVYVQNNGVDAPQYWDGDPANNLVALPAWPVGYKAGFMRAFGNFLVAGDVTRAGVRESSTLLWSHVADPWSLPDSWDIADTTKDAGDWAFAETNGRLKDCLPLGNMNIVYKDDSIYYQQPVQSSAIFRFGRLPGDTGLLARGCVAQIPGSHVLLTPGLDLVVHSGQGMQSLITGRMRTWLQNNINQTQAIRSFLAVSPQTSELLVCFPDGANTACTKALVWNWKDNTFSVRDLANATYGSAGQVTIASSTTWAGATTTWTTETTTWAEHADISGLSRLLFTTTGPRLVLFDSSEQDLGNSFTATIEQTGIHFDSPETVKLARGFRPKIDAAAGTEISIQLGASMVPDGAVTWGDAVTFTVGTDIQADAFATGRFLAWRMRTTGNAWWRVRSAQMDLEPMGEW